MQQIKFNQTDLLNYNEIDLLIRSDFPNERALIITNKLKHYIFIYENIVYVFNKDTITYKQIEDSIGNKKDDFIISKISCYIEASIKNLNEHEMKSLKYDHPKSFNKICENSNISRSLSQIRVELTMVDKPFKPDYFQLHFKNGYIDLRTLEFKQRIVGEDFIKNYINRDYEKSNEEKEKYFFNILKQIYPNEKDLETMLFILGSALTGKATKLQKILFLLGDGSAGKSTIMEITQSAIGCYFETLPDYAFSDNNKDKNKSFSTFYNNESVRIIWTNEPKTDKMDASTFKKFCEGTIKGELLYKNGTYEFSHNGLPIFTANEMPNINIDTGVKRRFRAYNHTSYFTEVKSEVNEEKNIYYKNLLLLDNIIEKNMLNTWIEILCRYAKRWLEGEEIPITENFNKATDEIIEVNDIVKDFVESKLLITKVDMDITARREDRIGKNEMLDLYREMYPKRGITTQLLIPKLRNFKIEYDKGIIGNDGTRGCFVGVKIKNTNDDEEDLTINKLYPALDTKEKDNEIKLLKLKILELEDYITNLKPKAIEETKEDTKKETKRQIKNTVDEEERNIDDESEELSLKDHIKRIKDEAGITTISKPKEVEEIIIKKSKPKKEKKEKEETVKKGSNQKTKKKYNETITEIFNCDNVKEMDEIDF